MGLERLEEEDVEERRRRGMARPVDMKNKRKEVEVDVGLEEEAEQNRRGGVSEKRSKLNVVGSSSSTVGGDEGGESEGVGRDDGGNKGEELVVDVQRILEARRGRGMSVRPLPVFMGDKMVDLLALNVRVSIMGGYSKVTEAGLWASIADALGLGLECGPGLKLVYVKYLKALESDKHSTEQRSGFRLCASAPISSELRTRVDGALSVVLELCDEELSREAEVGHENGDCSPGEVIDQHRFLPEHVLRNRGRIKEVDTGNNNAGPSVSDVDASGDQRGRRDNQGECRQALTSGDWASTYASVEHLARNPSDRGDQAHGSDEDAGTSDDWYEGEREESVQQQREALSGMLEWIKRVALSPGDPTAGLGEEGSSQNEDWASQWQMLTTKVRSVLWKEHRGGDGYMQAKQTPSLYYDEPVRPDSQTLERLRATRERLAHYGFQPPPGPNYRGVMSSYQDRNDGSYSAAQATQRSTRQPVNYSELANPRPQHSRKRIPIGPDFQADLVPWVPPDLSHRSGDTIQDELAGEGPSSSDDEDNDERWLGERVWPISGRGTVGSSDRIGKGRPALCDCNDPESMDCVRLHIAMAREQLKSELGEAFYQMGFDQMGECVADCWSKEERHTFRLLAQTNPASKDKNFWDELPHAFPFKSKKELISYYFNVFVLKRRALQNRLDGLKIDSDDDETELPDESDDSDFASSDDEDEDDEEEDDDEDEGADDAGSEDMPDAYPLKLPDDTGLRSLGPLSGYNYSDTVGLDLHEGERARSAPSTVDLEEASNHVRHDHADSSHVVLVWDDKHLEAGSLVRDGVLPQGRHWEEPRWDDRDHQQVIPDLGEAVSSRQFSPPTGKEDTRQSTALGELWSQHMEMAPKREKDRLLSTNGMILELFGDDVRN